MIEWIHPGVIILLGSLLIPVIKWRRVKQVYFLLLPLIALIILIFTSFEMFENIPFSAWHIQFLSYELVLGRIDRLSMVFAYAFVIAAIYMNIYALHVDRDWEHVSAMFYVGSTLGVVFAGDLFTLYFFWEVMAWTSLFLIWFRGTKKAHGAGFRYILWHLFGSICLLGGIVLHVQATGSIDFVSFTEYWHWNFSRDCLPYYFILLAFIINAAVPPFHSWLPDAYPEATVTGAVYLTAFTTKSAVYALIRGFSGVEVLMWLGAIMAMYGVIFAVLENDGRRLLAYGIVSQVGYMVSGVGIGTKMAINGATAHAFSHVLYKALLFMGMGAVIEKTGKSKLTELGGIYKYMPITFWLYMIGAFSISGFPLFNGFVSKTMTVYSSALIHQPIVWLLLEGASIGTFLYTGLKLPWNVWFAREKPANVEAEEPPKSMLAGMFLTGFLCIFFGIYPGYKILYNILPYQVEYHSYAPAHVIGISELLLFTFIAFWILREKLRGEQKITLDTDWLVRIPGKRFIWFCERPLMAFGASVDRHVLRVAGAFTWLEEKIKRYSDTAERRGVEFRFSLGTCLLIVLLLFLLYLIMHFI